MTPYRSRGFSRLLGLLGAAMLPMAGWGCGPKVEEAVVAAPLAPLRPVEVKVETLPAVKFVEITKEAGISFVHANGAGGEKLLPETMGAGAAFLDYDGDGDQDLLFVNSCPWPGPGPNAGRKPTQALYRNDGKGHFEDVTENANAKGPNGWLTGAAFLDIENDGDLDLFICNYITWTPEIDKVQGFQLTGIGRAYGPPTSFGGSLCCLLRNDGGRFTDISEESGVQVRTPDLKVPLAKSLGVAPYDIDGDGLVDIAVANDTVQNFLFHNKGKGKFEEVAILSGIAFDQSGSPRGGMGCDWACFLNDDRLGLAIGNFANEMTALYVSDQPSGLQFSDLANLYGLGAPTQPPLKFGLFFFDYDLDGRLDLLSANGHLEPEISKVQASESYEQPAQLFWNSGKIGRNLYARVGPETAGPDLFKPMVGRGSTYADIDADGDLDVVVVVNNGPARLFRNDGGNANHWIRLKLEGDGKASNREAIGAKVELRMGDHVCRRQLFPAKSYLSSVELPITFGLGKDDKAESITITWPSGKTTKLSNLKANQVYTIDEVKGLQ